MKMLIKFALYTHIILFASIYSPVYVKAPLVRETYDHKEQIYKLISDEEVSKGSTKDENEGQNSSQNSFSGSPSSSLVQSDQKIMSDTEVFIDLETLNLLIGGSSIDHCLIKFRPSSREKYSDRVSIYECIEPTVNFNYGNSLYSDESKTGNIKTFTSHIKEGTMPKFGAFKSPLAEAFTAALIMVQETGIVDQLINENKISVHRCKFLYNTLFDTIEVGGPYIEDKGVGDYIGIYKIQEYKRFLQSKKKVHPEILTGNEDLEVAALNFALNMMPKLRFELPIKGDELEKHLRVCTDLEDVLLRKEIVVVIHSPEYQNFINFKILKTNSFFHRLLNVITEIISRNYYHSDGNEIKIKYLMSQDPVGDLLDNRAHMTGLYFVMEEQYSSKVFFEKKLESLKIPVLSYDTYIVVHKKFKINTLDSWYNYVKNPPGGKRVIVTNFTNGSILFTNSKNFKIITVTLKDQNQSPIGQIECHRAIAGLFWGIDSNMFRYSDYDFLELPYSIDLGPLFSTSFKSPG